MAEPDTMADKLCDLLVEDYSVRSLIHQAQQNRLSLSELRDNLLKRQQDLNQASIELFNTNYDRFFKLSHHIAGLNEPIENMLHPIQLYHDKLNELCQKHDAYLDRIDKNISLLESTSKNKFLAKILIKLIGRRNRIFEQLDQLKWLNLQSIHGLMEQYDPKKLEQKIEFDSIERLTVELHHLYCETLALEPTRDELIPIKQSLESSISAKRAQLTTWFRQVFHEAVVNRNRHLIDFVLSTYNQINDDYQELDIDKYFREHVNESLDIIATSMKEQPLTELEPGLDEHPFKVKICLDVFKQILRCWSPDFYIEALDLNFAIMVYRILEKFSDWLGKLRLSDFRIVGTRINPENPGGTTNFLAKQDAIMRLFIEDCTRLINKISEYESNSLPGLEPKLRELRRAKLSDGINAMEEGMTNVRNLQKLLER